MQVCKCAMQIIRGNLVFPIVYIIGLSFMGVFMAQSFDFGDIDQTLERKNVEYSVVDRDGSELSRSIEAFLEQRGVPVEIDDSRRAFQDAVAKGQTDYLLIIPEGYENEFRNAVLEEGELPQLQVVFSYYSSKGILMDEMVDGYLGIVRSLLLASPDAAWGSVLGDAASVASARADVQVFDAGNGVSEADRFIFYMRWSTYTLFAGIVICVGMLISTMNRTDVRRRNLSSPMSYASYNIQLAISCSIFAVMACVWTFVLGLVVFPQTSVAMSFEGLVLCGASMMMYSCMALAFGFMLGQFAAKALMCNAFGNIFGMVISFFGGAWVPLDLMSPDVLALAHWLPGFWYTDACQRAASLDGTALSDVMAVLTDLGVLSLFVLTFLSVGFVAARRRLQTTEAGGNRAAEAL